MTRAEPSTTATTGLQVPSWAQPPDCEVRSALATVVQHVQDTAAPASAGAMEALMWAVSVPEDRQSPVIKQQRERTLLIAVSEIEVGGAICAGSPYPDAAWWAERQIDPSRTLSRQLWDELIVTGSAREFASGAARALGWLVGAQERATCMVPRRDGDGRWFTKHELDVMAFQLFRFDYPDDVVRRMLTAPGVDPNNLL
jgi:hypothetical protein